MTARTHASHSDESPTKWTADKVLRRDSASPDGSKRPYVSIVIPCLNEEEFINQLLVSLSSQYDEGQFEIIVVDGHSTDRTLEVIAKFASGHPGINITVIDNKLKHIPVALNLGISRARGEIIVRMDAHSIPSANYIHRCVEVLSRQDRPSSVVGMPWKIQPSSASAVAQAIALAVSHPFGIGDAKYRLREAMEQSVDTVPFGAFRRDLWTRMGGFNEELLANEDYEFNYRVRKSGGQIQLDASAHSVYYARKTFKTLSQQYFRYGFWKAQMLKLFPESLRLRQLAAPLMLLSIVLLVALAPFHWIARLALVVMVSSYAVLAAASAWQLSRRKRDFGLWLPIVSAFPIIHFSWGSGFFVGLFRSARRG
jgi:glycosyltransferase involved in cell wall biosynthesis